MRVRRFAHALAVYKRMLIHELQSTAVRIAEMSKQTLHLFTATEIAEELALRDAELLRRIEPSEIRDRAWMHKDKVCACAHC